MRQTFTPPPFILTFKRNRYSLIGNLALTLSFQESYVRSDEFGRDLSSVQTLLTKQETFDIGLEAFENEGKYNLLGLLY